MKLESFLSQGGGFLRLGLGSISGLQIIVRLLRVFEGSAVLLYRCQIRIKTRPQSHLIVSVASGNYLELSQIFLNEGADRLGDHRFHLLCRRSQSTPQVLCAFPTSPHRQQSVIMVNNGLGDHQRVCGI